ncbi:hypothetical protein QFZ27_007315 [Inquilinus ginsengisoli]|uniref:hypothetical protein n=1 Tax=Inquilinus ginsengisoli TaxID=363840 RepID=UPI003D249F7B
MDIRDRLGSGRGRRHGAALRGEALWDAASTAIKWVEQWRRTSVVVPRPRGGDQCSQRLEAHAEEILGLIEQTPDITLSEITAHLDPERLVFIDETGTRPRRPAAAAGPAVASAAGRPCRTDTGRPQPSSAPYGSTA